MSFRFSLEQIDQAVNYLDENEIIHKINKSKIKSIEKTVTKILNQE